MSILIGSLYVVEIVVCLLLAGIILLQKPKAYYPASIPSEYNIAECA